MESVNAMNDRDGAATRWRSVSITSSSGDGPCGLDAAGVAGAGVEVRTGVSCRFDSSICEFNGSNVRLAVVVSRCGAVEVPAVAVPAVPADDAAAGGDES